jgi:hypothetical protein
MYRGLKDTLVPMARESVVAHLLKLEHEGRARRAAASASGASAPKGDAAPEEQAWHIIEP